MNLTPVPSTTHEAICRVADPSVGLIGFIAVHSTTLGPAAGGLRMRTYPSEAAAIHDVTRLSEGMTYKNASAGLPLGGGKAVIVGDPTTLKTPELLETFGRAVNELQGQYWTAEDMGMKPADMAVIRRQTPYVAGLPDGEFASGDPSPVTARGIFNAIKTACKHKHGSDDLSGLIVAVQGLGNVGEHLCRFLTEAGARLIVTDVNPRAVEAAAAELGAEAVAPDAIYGVQADIFAPCAIGGILTADVIDQLQVGIVAGGANNQLPTNAEADQLHARGILYAPDFVANGGGIINAAAEILKIEDRTPWVAARLDNLDSTMTEILNAAQQAGTSPHQIALQVVKQKLADRAA